MTEREALVAAGQEAATGESRSLAPGLYLVATPIGNLQDLSPRARSVLAEAARVVCEDTRVTGRLLHLLGIEASLTAYHEHNAERVRPRLLEALADGAALALVSDAGTPLVSDPGYKLVRAARAAGHAVVPVPGPSAVLAALTASGLATDRFFFQGFLPAKAAARERVIQELARVPATLVVFENATRTAATLGALARELGGREAVVARELTKRFEAFRQGTLAELAEGCAREPPRGEVVLVIAGPATSVEPMDSAALDAALLDALAEVAPSEAARRVAAQSGRPRRALYARALELQRR